MTTPYRPALADMEEWCAAFNRAIQPDTAVRVVRDNRQIEVQRTTSGAYVLSGHTPVIHLTGISGCYALERVMPCDDPAAANGLNLGEFQPRFYIVSPKHSPKRDRYITLWRPDNAGYAWPLPWAGLYTSAQLRADEWLNDGRDTMAVPEHVIDMIATAPEPGDIAGDAGPAVRNTAEMMAVLRAARVAPERVRA